ncbi:MAG: alpha/beta hydrolase [Anaerolineae bacterium]
MLKLLIPFRHADPISTLCTRVHETEQASWHTKSMRFKKQRKWLFFLFLLGFTAVNWVSWNHAWRMTHFVEMGERTKSPEDLSTFEKIPLLVFGITVPRPQTVQTPADYDLTFEAVLIESGEHTLSGWVIPSQTQPTLGTILLFHGYASAKDNLLTEAEAFHQMGYTTMLVDFRGSGSSTGQNTTVGYEEAEDVEAAFRFAQDAKLAQPILMYGMSMGGAAAMRAVATTDIKPDGLIIEAVFDEMLSTVENRFDAMGIPSFPAAELLVFWGGVQVGFNGFQHNPADYAEEISIPILLLHGQNDPRATLEQGEKLFECLASADKKMVVFQGAEHESNIHVDSDLWRSEVEGFLNTISNR